MLGMSVDRNHVYAVTNVGAPNYKVVRTNVEHPDWPHAETVIPEASDSIQRTVRSKHHLFVVYSNGIVGRLVKYNLSCGEITELKLPASGAVSIQCPDSQSDRCLVSIRSWTTPVTIYELDGSTDSFVTSSLSADVRHAGLEDIVAEEVEAWLLRMYGTFCALPNIAHLVRISKLCTSPHRLPLTSSPTVEYEAQTVGIHGMEFALIP